MNTQNNNYRIQYMINKALLQKLKARSEMFYIQMNVTNHCSDNCWHCYLRGNHNLPYEVGVEEFIEILKQAKIWAESHSKRLIVDLIGGDPLLKPDIDMLLTYLSKENINYGIKGNPYLLAKNIERLVELQCRRYQMSLDGLETTHDAIRSPGSFQATLEAINLLYVHQMPVTIKYTMSEKNSTDLWELLYMLYEKNIHISNFLVARYHDKNGQGFHVSKQYYEETFERIKAFYDMQIQNHDVRIQIALKEHLWIPYLSGKQYLFKDFYDLLEKNPYLSSCSMISSNATVVTPEGYFDVCPKISGFCKTKDMKEYMERKQIFVNEIRRGACVGCEWRTVCLGCPAFYTRGSIQRDCDCFFC